MRCEKCGCSFDKPVVEMGNVYKEGLVYGQVRRNEVAAVVYCCPFCHKVIQWEKQYEKMD